MTIISTITTLYNAHKDHAVDTGSSDKDYGAASGTVSEVPNSDEPPIKGGETGQNAKRCSGESDGAGGI
ncbi:hypothetical protein FRB99_004236 [Tulasnella sp. 403]|nr:hypothetical protein FRB99_004236 [Tulasnella sp. 403]